MIYVNVTIYNNKNRIYELTNPAFENGVLAIDMNFNEGGYISYY